MIVQMKLPVSLQLVYALYASSFQLPSLALLSIVNTRAKVPAEYLPAYGAIAFLPFSLRPFFAWVSSLLLHFLDGRDAQRHDKLLPPALAFASLTYAGTMLVPSDGIVACFALGFMRGVASAWVDFLLGLCIIEISKRRASLDGIAFSCTTSSGGTPGSIMSTSASPKTSDSLTYDQRVSLFTAQSRTASNLGSLVASIVTFGFFARTNHLEAAQVTTLLIVTAILFLAAAGVALKYQSAVTRSFNTISGLSRRSGINGNVYDAVQTIEGHEEAELKKAATITSVDQGASTIATCFPSTQESSPLATSSWEYPGSLLSHSKVNTPETPPESGIKSQQCYEISSLVVFQTLLAVSALEKPIAAASSHLVWLSAVFALAVVLIATLFAGCFFEGQHSDISTQASPPLAYRTSARVPYRRLSLYLLLRHILPISSYVLYSYLFTVFSSQPAFLQFMSVLQTASGSIATLCYEKFLAPRCHSGWPLIGLIASLDVVTGLAALLDVVVIRTLQSNDRVNDEDKSMDVSIDLNLKLLVLTVEVVKYFFAEMDYMPSVILSTSNVVSKHDEQLDSCTGVVELSSTPDMEHADTDALLTDTISTCESSRPKSASPEPADGNDGIFVESDTDHASNTVAYSIYPTISVGMQYASFVSCIDFGAQIGQWISVPIIVALGVSRENHWNNLDWFVITCSLCRMARSAFLWLIFPSSSFPTS